MKYFAFGGLFSGIGMFELAAEWMGWEIIFHCEINEFGQKILKHYWPKAISYADITKTDFTIHRGAIDILTGGDPCQPSSIAGKQKGKEDERYLWPEFKRCIKELEPVWIVNENVSGTVSNGILDTKINDLEHLGYSCWSPFVITASAFGFPHQRKRVWLVAHSERARLQRHNPKRENLCLLSDETQSVHSNENVFNGSKEFRGYSQYIRSSNGNARKLDKHRVKSIGNAIIPQIALEIFKIIEQNDPPTNSTP